MKVNANQIPRQEPVGALSLKGGEIRAEKEAVAAKIVAREFEALMVGMMLKSMRSTVGKETLVGKGNGEETYRTLLDQEYAKAVAGQGGLGLAMVIEQQLQRPAPAAGTDELEVSGDE